MGELLSSTMKMSSTKNQPLFHIAMYPWFAFGHLTSFLNLANKFAERGHKISFILPNKAKLTLSSLNNHPTLINFITIDVPHVGGLPLAAETTKDLTNMTQMPLLMSAMDLTKDTIDTHLAHLKPDFIFFDFPLWVPGLARKHGSKSIFYTTLHVLIFAYDHKLTKNNDFTQPPPGFPNPDIRLQAHEARAVAFINGLEFGGGMSFSQRLDIAMRESDALGFKSCREIEGDYCDFFEKNFGKPILLAGPMVPEPITSGLDEHINGWLNGFSHGSVVYCAFGSECVLEKHIFQELVLGLELSGRPFLAALKPPNGCETIELALPEEFKERTKGRGIVHGGWVQQQLILQHPSVGCFVTHCGAGSLSEAMVNECQLVLMPQQADQFLNARLMSLQLKVGVEVDKRESDGYFTKEAVNYAISMVMEPQSDVAKEIRANHAKWRNLFLREGLEESYINSFIQSLQDLLGKE